jgi:hypothetical protein
MRSSSSLIDCCHLVHAITVILSKAKDPTEQRRRSLAFTYVRGAIAREKQLKGWPHDRKIALIESVNSAWDELRFDGDLPDRHGVLRFAQDDSKD